MATLSRSRYRARFAEGSGDLHAAQALRFRAFVGAPDPGCDPDGRDADAFDSRCRHVLVEDRPTGALVACYRLLPLSDGAQIQRSYAAQFYDLSRLRAFPRRMVEMGRFCVAPGLADPDILRVAWAALTRYVDTEGVAMIFGCSSFRGTDARAYRDAFAMLNERHLAPGRWRPSVKAPSVVPFDRTPSGQPDENRAFRTMPPMLRSYLAMGGWVSDHAVVDRDLGTLHVFTGLEIAAIPAARARVLREMATG